MCRAKKLTFQKKCKTYGLSKDKKSESSKTKKKTSLKYNNRFIMKISRNFNDVVF